MSQPFDFERLVELCRHIHDEARRSAAHALERSLVVRNWLFGWYIVEYQQSGADRAEYGSQTLERLSAALKERIGRGFSVDALERMRRSYLGRNHILLNVPVSDPVSDPASDKSATLSRFSGNQPGSATALRILAGSSAAKTDTLAQLADRLPLGWSHHVTLLTVTDSEASRFYEIEAAENGWSVRELRRQLNSSLYEPLALSRDKREVRRLAREGQVVEKASDLIKDPVVLEFLGLEEKPDYSEGDLDAAIINRLQQFLLELGKGFLFEARQKRFSSTAAALSSTSSTTDCCAATC